MKILFAILLMAAPALADSNVLTCQVNADGIAIPKGSYVELDPSGPFLSLYKDYSRKNGPVYFVKSDLVSNSYLSSWRVERASQGCSVSTSGTDSLNLQFNCEKVGQFLNLQGFMTYDANTASGHYNQNGLTSEGREMNFEFDFFGCY